MGRGNDVINDILDALDEDMLTNYDEYALECVEPWATFNGNHGQMVIVQKYIIPAAEQHANDARPDWPQSDTPDDYVEAIYGCYDEEVIASAFSDTIQEIYESLNEYWLYASGVQDEHAYIAGPENAGPHSTHVVWRG